MPSSSPNATRVYFAYSTILDPEELDRWMADHGHRGFKLPAGKVAEAPNSDLVYNCPSEKWGGRVAGITRKSGSSVFGLLFEVPASAWPVLEHAEGVKGGKFQELELEVRIAAEGGRTVKATTFTTRPQTASTSGPVSQKFANTLARGAERAGLPAEYVTKLKAEALILDRVQSYGQQHHLK